VIVGGGKVAERKSLSLLRAGAEVTVISPRITRKLEVLTEKGMIRLVRRSYRRCDIRSAFVIIAATDSEKTNRKVAAHAAADNVLVNVVDKPSLCNFIVPSVLRQGALTIAVSTGGVSPAMARSIRKELKAHYDTRYSAYLRLLKGIRARVMEKIPEKGKRERILKVIASEDLIGILVRDGFMAAKKEAYRRLRESGL